MPFNIAHSGPAPVSTYFRVKPTTVSLPLPPSIPSAQSNPHDENKTTDPDSMELDTTPLNQAHELPDDGQPIPSPSQPAAKLFTSAFRGRAMQGLAVDLPQGYTGLVLRGDSSKFGTTQRTKTKEKRNGKGRTSGKQKTAKVAQEEVDDAEELHGEAEGMVEGDEDAIRVLRPTAKFDSFVLWYPDIPVDEGKDEYLRSLNEWIGLAAEVCLICTPVCSCVLMSTPNSRSIKLKTKPSLCAVSLISSFLCIIICDFVDSHS